MNARFGSMCPAAVAVVLFSGTVEAQIIATPTVQYQSAANGKPATAEPKGIISLPADSNFYRVYCDYGMIADGAFTAAAMVSKGGPSRIVLNKLGVNPISVGLLGACQRVLPITLCDPDGNTNWWVSGPQTLTNPTAGLHARARIQVLNGIWWVDVPDAVTYAPVPIPE